MMKQLYPVISWVALVAVAVLFVLHFNHTEMLKRDISVIKKFDSANFRIAYFNIDTLQANFDEFKDAESKLKAKESSSRNTMNELNIRYQRRLNELQEKARVQSMSQAEGEAAQQELARMENAYKQKDLELDQELKKMQMDLMGSLNKKVEDYLKDYNKDRGFAYIFSYQPGALIYYKDTIYDITRELIRGLNIQYKKAK
jgi:outer membrane protein